MGIWSETTLNGLIHIKHGYAFLGQYFSDSGEYVVLTPGNFFEKGGFRFREGKEKFYLGEIPESFILKKHDLIVAMTEQGEGLLGSTAFIPENGKYLHNQRLGLIDILDKETLDKVFLYYLMNNQYIRSQIRNTSTGTKVRHTSPKSIYNVKVFLPPILQQKKIAGILSTYDDLIENNKKRIQILENMAEELYKEWFVRFRFPNWENTKFEKGIPKDWKIEKISSLVDRKKFGRVYKEFELSLEGGIPVIDQSQKNILGFHEGEAEHIASFESPMIIFGDHSCKMQLVFKNFSLAENVIPFKSKHNISLLYLFSLIKDQVETTEYKRHWGELTNKKVLLAPLNLQEEYANLIIDKMKLIENLKMANNLLINSRGQLLPRLISGKLSVENLDIQFPVSMQG